MGNNNTKNNNYKNNNIKIDFDETILDIESKNQFYNNYNYETNPIIWEQLKIEPLKSFRENKYRNLEEKDELLKIIIYEIQDLQTAEQNLNKETNYLGSFCINNCRKCKEFFFEIMKNNSLFDDNSLRWKSFMENIKVLNYKCGGKCELHNLKPIIKEEYEKKVKNREVAEETFAQLEIGYKVALQQQKNLSNQLEEQITEYKEKNSVLILKKKKVQNIINCIQISIIIVSSIITFFESINLVFSEYLSAFVVIFVPIFCSTYIGLILSIGRFFKYDTKIEQIIKLIEKYSFIINKFRRKRSKYREFDFKIHTLDEWNNMLSIMEKDSIDDIIMKANEECDLIITPNEYVHYKKLYIKTELKESITNGNFLEINKILKNNNMTSFHKEKIFKLIKRRNCFKYYLCCMFCCVDREYIDYDLILVKNRKRFEKFIKSNKEIILNNLKKKNKNGANLLIDRDERDKTIRRKSGFKKSPDRKDFYKAKSIGIDDKYMDFYDSPSPKKTVVSTWLSLQNNESNRKIKKNKKNIDYNESSDDSDSSYESKYDKKKIHKKKKIIKNNKKDNIKKETFLVGDIVKFKDNINNKKLTGRILEKEHLYFYILCYNDLRKMEVKKEDIINIESYIERNKIFLVNKTEFSYGSKIIIDDNNKYKFGYILKHNDDTLYILFQNGTILKQEKFNSNNIIILEDNYFQKFIPDIIKENCLQINDRIKLIFVEGNNHRNEGIIIESINTSKSYKIKLDDNQIIDNIGNYLVEKIEDRIIIKEDDKKEEKNEIEKTNDKKEEKNEIEKTNDKKEEKNEIEKTNDKKEETNDKKEEKNEIEKTNDKKEEKNEIEKTNDKKEEKNETEKINNKKNK
jgi:hypothetical protein